jgi:organic hydroperoxide reductase OsmC/OhrA
MNEYTATIVWNRGEADFSDGRYPRQHVWQFDGGAEILASASPHVVRPPLSDPAAVDPEEGFVAALSSCHMLWFLAVARKRGFVVDDYRDPAVGVMGKAPDGKVCVTEVTLRPVVAFAGEKQPTGEELQQMHHQAHEQCYIANSVKSAVRVEPELG